MMILMTLPFIFIRSFYPFYRFGMFAESITTDNKIEKFLIYYKNSKGIKTLFYAPDIGINVSTFEYVKRNYFYGNQSKKLLENISKHYTSEEISNWELYKVIWESNNKSDTVKVYTLK